MLLLKELVIFYFVTRTFTLLKKSVVQELVKNRRKVNIYLKEKQLWKCPCVERGARGRGGNAFCMRSLVAGRTGGGAQRWMVPESTWLGGRRRRQWLDPSDVTATPSGSGNAGVLESAQNNHRGSVGCRCFTGSSNSLRSQSLTIWMWIFIDLFNFLLFLLQQALRSGTCPAHSTWS